MRPVTWFLVFAILLMFVGNTSTFAAPASVDTIYSLGEAQLRYVIASADPGTTITFGVTGTIVLTGFHIDIDRDLTIIAPSLGNITIDGHQVAHIFSIAPGVHVKLSNLILAGSLGGGESHSPRGGCIFNQGSLELTNDVIDDCRADAAAGGGGIDNAGTLTMTNTTISHALAYWAGGLWNTGTATVTNSTFSYNRGSPFGPGGGIGNFGTMSIINSTFNNNSLAEGAAIGNWGTVTITGSTIVNNIGVEGPGGILNTGTMIVTNTTIAHNTGTSPERHTAGGIEGHGTSTVVNSTIVHNSGDSGGIRTTGMFILKNSIVALNTGPVANDIGGAVTSQGYNLIGQTAGGSGFVSTDLQNVDISTTLGDLASNGGPTQTIALLAGNPAIDSVPSDACGMSTDQRGIIRPQGPACDSGAYEAIVLGMAHLTSPRGVIHRSKPTFTWNPVPYADSYYLWVLGPHGVVIARWLDSQSTCPTGAPCSLKSPVSFRNGVYLWAIETRREGVLGPWSFPMLFVVRGQAPGKVTLVSPSGKITTHTPTFVWKPNANAEWYQLEIKGPRGVQFTRWYIADKVCSASTCQSTPNLNLARGDYSWRIRAWGGDAQGPWSPSMKFRVSASAAPNNAAPSTGPQAAPTFIPSGH